MNSPTTPPTTTIDFEDVLGTQTTAHLVVILQNILDILKANGFSVPIDSLSSTINSTPVIKCFFCGEVGHIRNECKIRRTVIADLDKKQMQIHKGSTQNYQASIISPQVVKNNTSPTVTRISKYSAHRRKSSSSSCSSYGSRAADTNAHGAVANTSSFTSVDSTHQDSLPSIINQEYTCSPSPLNGRKRYNFQIVNEYLSQIESQKSSTTMSPISSLRSDYTTTDSSFSTTDNKNSPIPGHQHVVAARCYTHHGKETRPTHPPFSKPSVYVPSSPSAHPQAVSSTPSVSFSSRSPATASHMVPHPQSLYSIASYSLATARMDRLGLFEANKSLMGSDVGLKNIDICSCMPGGHVT